MMKMKQFKRILTVLCVMALLCAMCPLGTAPVFAEKAGDFTYNINDDGTSVTVTRYTGSETAVVIPDTINGYPVTRIGDCAFTDCTVLQNITIPDCVTSIGWHAFYNTAYYNNTSNWNQQVLYIENYLIEAKTDIAGDYVIKDGTTAIAYGAFRDCTLLESIFIPDSVTFLNHAVFSGCAALQNITLPDNAMFIGSFAFKNTAYYNHEENWEQQVLYIGNHLIEAQNTINGDYVMKDGTKTIAYGAFQHCTLLENIAIADSVTTIGGAAFNGCTALQCIAIPSGVTSIGEMAFYGCSSLKRITLESGITDIPHFSFGWCTSLESVIVSDSVKSIASHAFYECTALKTVYYSGSRSTWDAMIIQQDNAAFTKALIRFEGDLTGFEVIDIADATLLFRAVNGRIRLSPEEEAVADITDDGAINIADATMLFRYINGRISTLD